MSRNIIMCPFVIIFLATLIINYSAGFCAEPTKKTAVIMLNKSSCLNKNPLSVKVDSQFDSRNVWPLYVTGIGTILVALTTIYVVYKSSKQTIKASDNFARTQLDTSNNQIKSQIDIAKKDRIKELNLVNRQNWINDLRDTVSKYLQLLYDMHYTQNKLNYKSELLASLKKGELRKSSLFRKTESEQSETEDMLVDIYSKLQLHASKIELLLNPNPSPDEQNLIDNLRASKESDQPITFIEPIKTVTKAILKTEWSRIQTEISA